MIRNHFYNLWDAFLKKCKEIDINKTELISYNNFQKICKSFKLDYSSEIEHYLKVLFYINNFQLNIVSYKTFFIDYSSDKKQKLTKKIL